MMRDAIVRTMDASMLEWRLCADTDTNCLLLVFLGLVVAVFHRMAGARGWGSFDDYLSATSRVSKNRSVVLATIVLAAIW